MTKKKYVVEAHYVERRLAGTEDCWAIIYRTESKQGALLVATGNSYDKYHKAGALRIRGDRITTEELYTEVL